MADPDSLDNESEELAEIQIQKETFANWINDKLKPKGISVTDLRGDLRDGVRLCRLMEQLKGQDIGRVQAKPNLNHYAARANLQLAMQAMQHDGITLVNIGAEDISGGNLKLILGLCWLLIRRYQIGARSRLPTKKIMLAWINAVLHPELQVTNFSSDWNDGVALHGIIEYCQPDSAPHWKTMEHKDRLKNCREGLSLAEDLFGIPQVVSAENLASEDLDDLSGMTYLSYFMAEGGPGYKATLQWVKDTLTPQPVHDFMSSWNDGVVITDLVRALGCTLPDLSSAKPEGKCSLALSVSQRQFSIPAFMMARDILPPNADHIALMAHVAWLQALSLHCPPRSVSADASRELHVGSSVGLPFQEPVTQEEEEEVPPATRYADGIELVTKSQWAIDRALTVHIKTPDPSERDFRVVAHSPSGGETTLPVLRTATCVYDVTFTPTETGIWTIAVNNDQDTPVSGSPFSVMCYDVMKAEIVRDDEGPVPINELFCFHVRTAEVNSDEVRAHVLYGSNSESLPLTATPGGTHLSKVTFMPRVQGNYLVSVYVGGFELSESPFTVLAEDMGSVTVSGKGLRFGLQRHPSSFIINTSANRNRNFKVTITGPHQLPVSTECRTSRDGNQITVTFIPPVKGTYKIDVIYSNHPVPGSPFYPEITGAHIYIQGLQAEVTLGKSSSFTVDAGEMSTGMLEIDSDLPVLSYAKEGEKKYRVTFIPKRAGMHDLLVKYNEILVAESPYIINVVSH